MDVWVTDNSSTKRRGQYIAYTVTRAADGPDGMEARGRPFSVGGKGLSRASGLKSAKVGTFCAFESLKPHDRVSGTKIWLCAFLGESYPMGQLTPDAKGGADLELTYRQQKSLDSP